MANNPAPTIDEVLKLVEKYGFKFFGRDENNNVLVVAPNGQIVQLVVAHKFVLDQISRSSQAPVGPESMPQMPNLPNSDTKLERSFETEKGPDDTKSQVNTQGASALTVHTKTPQVKAIAEPPKLENPYGDGFKLSFNPADLNKTDDYMKKNITKPSTSSAKWLATQFEKFLAEQKGEMQ
jgi:hypothetical protein